MVHEIAACQDREDCSRAGRPGARLRAESGSRYQPSSLMLALEITSPQRRVSASIKCCSWLGLMDGCTSTPNARKLAMASGDWMIASIAAARRSTKDRKRG